MKLLTNGRDGQPNVAADGAVDEGLEVNGPTKFGQQQRYRHCREKQKTRQRLPEADALQVLVGPAQLPVALLLATVVELLHKPAESRNIDLVYCKCITKLFQKSLSLSTASYLYLNFTYKTAYYLIQL